MDDEDLLVLLQSILQDRTGVLQALVDWAVPGFVYIPSKAITEHRILGTVKSCNHDSGNGFISCPEVQEVFNTDVFLHASQTAGVQVGDAVNFAVLLNKDQKPQAFDVLLGEPGARPGKGAPAPWKGGDEWGGEAKGSWGGKAWAAEWSPSAHPMASPAASAPPAHVPVAPPAVPERIPPAAPQSAHPMAAPSPVKGKGYGEGYGKGYGKDAGESYGVPVPPVPPAAVHGLAKGGKASPKGKSGAGHMEGVTDRRFEGSVKSFNFTKGFGFICSEEVQGIFGQGIDVFVHHAQIGDFQVNDQVSFAIILNKDQKPQAMEVWPAAEAAKRSRWS